MRNKDFEITLKQALHQSPQPETHAHLEQTLLLVGKELCQRHKRERIPFTHFLTKQVQFIGWKVWAAQSVFLFLIGGMFTRTYGSGLWENPHFMIRLLCCLSVLVSMTALPFLYRSIRYRMQEVEAAAYFSAVKLLMAKLVVVGIGDICILAGIFLITMAKSSLTADSALFYLCIPFLLISSVCLFLLGHCPPKQFFTGSMGGGACFLLLCAVVPGRYNLLFQQSFSVGWTVVCALLVLFCIQQLRYILYRSSYTEIQVVS